MYVATKVITKSMNEVRSSMMHAHPRAVSCTSEIVTHKK